jgi:hypothetical protein
MINSWFLVNSQGDIRELQRQTVTGSKFHRTCAYHASGNFPYHSLCSKPEWAVCNAPPILIVLFIQTRVKVMAAISPVADNLLAVRKF